MKVRAGNRYVYRPALEMLWEVLWVPLFVFAIWRELRRGW